MALPIDPQSKPIIASQPQYNQHIAPISESRDAQKLADLAEDFEAIFINLMLKSMRESVEKSELVDGGNGEEIFRSMLDQEYAKEIASQRGSGIADAIEREFRRFVEPQQAGKDAVTEIRAGNMRDQALKLYQSQKQI